ncbi:MAG: ABC transporter ATP-binding protein [Acidobacteriota bacterium]
MNPTDAAVFQLDKVSFLYQRERSALEMIDLCIRPGEQIVVLGANGCGKSSLLLLLAGLLQPTSGSLYAFGEEVTEEKLNRERFASFFRSRVGLVFQNPDVQLFCSTVWEELAFGPLQLDLPGPEVRHRCESVLQLLGIAHLRDRAPFQLSGGEKKKVAIASVLTMNPEVLLLDEPAGSLDPRTQAWLVEFLQQLRASGKTLVTASHDLSLIDEIATRAVVLGEDHRLAADGPVERILEDQELMLKANLIHEHTHHHGSLIHRHRHSHIVGHRHSH